MATYEGWITKGYIDGSSTVRVDLSLAFTKAVRIRSWRCPVERYAAEFAHEVMPLKVDIEMEGSRVLNVRKIETA